MGGPGLALAALLLAALLLAAAPRAVCGRWEATSFEWVELDGVRSPESAGWGAQPAANAPLGSSSALGTSRTLLRNIPRCKCNCKAQKCRKKVPGEKEKRKCECRGTVDDDDSGGGGSFLGALGAIGAAGSNSVGGASVAPSDAP